MATTTRMTKSEMRDLYSRACAAGREAFHAARPTAMIVGEPKNMMASLMGGDDGGIDHNKRTYHVSEGVCGFAWVTVRPGNCQFANWLRREAGGRRGYYGGMEVREIGDNRMSQSYERKVAAANAFAAVLRDAGINAYTDSRLD